MGADMQVNQIYNYKRSILRIIGLLLSTTLLFTGRCQKSDYKSSSDNLTLEELERLARSNSYEPIISRFNASHWARENDPSPFMIYCEALIETGTSLPSSLKAPYLPSYVSEFVKGYYDFLKGSFNDALNRFISIANNPEGKVWGHIGLLEFSLQTGCIKKMGDVLEALEIVTQNRSYNIPSWVLPTYHAWHSLYYGKFSETKRILHEFRKELTQLTASF